MNFVDTFSFYFYAGGGTFLFVAILPMLIWYWLERPRAMWPYYVVLGFAIVALLPKEPWEVLQAWWSAPDYAVRSDWLTPELLERFKLRVEFVVASVAVAVAVFAVGSA